MSKEYKVEMKPTLWAVTLGLGTYSDHVETTLYFSANDENEVWNFLCRYAEDVFTVEGSGYYPYGTIKAVKFECEDVYSVLHRDEHCEVCKKYIVQKWLQAEVAKGNGDDSVSWELDAHDVEISRVNVIHFLK